MLQKISDRIQGWIAGVVIAIIAAVFVLWGVEYYIGRGDNNTRVVATVNGQKIFENQVGILYRQLQQRMRAVEPNKSLSLEEQQQIKSLALQQLISRVALAFAANEIGFSVSQQQIQQIILQAPEFQVKGFFSPQRFQQFLMATQTTEQQFIAEIQSNFLINQVAVGLGASVFVLPDELKRAYQLIYQHRDFEYLTLPLSKFLPDIKIPDKEVQVYYQRNKEAYKTDQKVQVSYLLLSPSEIEKTIKIPLADLKAYYDSNFPTKVKSFESVKDEIQKRLARQQAQQILSQKSDQLSNLTYTNPNTLEIAAKKLGLTVQTSPWFTKVGLKEGILSNHSIVTAAFSSTVLQDKNNSDLINLPDGSVLVLRINRYEPSREQTFSEVKQLIQSVLQKNKAESKVGLVAYQVSTDLSNGTSPEVLAKRYGLQWVSKKSVQRDDKTTPAPILTSVFSTPPFVKGGASGVNTLVLANGDYVVLKVISAQLAGSSSILDKQRNQLEQGLAQLISELDYRLYAKSVIDHSKIKTH